MFQNFGKDFKVIRVQNAAVAATTNLVGATVDTAGFDACCFIYGVGALTGTQHTKLTCASGTDSGGSGAADIAASGTPPGATTFMPDADSNKLLILDIVRPAPGPSTSAVSGSPPTGGGVVPNRYLTPTLKRGTANAVVDFGIAILYNRLRYPMLAADQDTTVSGSPNVNVSQPQGVAA